MREPDPGGRVRWSHSVSLTGDLPSPPKRARLGAIHSVVFGGFAANELATRIDDCRPKVVLSASCGIEVGRIVHRHMARS